MSRIAVWAGNARDKLEVIANELKIDAEYLAKLADNLDGIPTEDARHVAGVVSRVARRARILAEWADIFVERLHSVAALLAWFSIELSTAESESEG